MKSWLLLVLCCVLGACAESRVASEAGESNRGVESAEAPGNAHDNEAGRVSSKHRAESADAVEHFNERADAEAPRQLLEVADAGIIVDDDRPIGGGGPAPRSECEYEVEGEPTTLTVPTEYATIQQAIDAARPLDTVHVLPGTYDGSLQLRTGVRLIGSGAEATILDGGERPENLIDFTDAHDAVVSGFTLRNVGQGLGCAQPDDVLACSGNWYASAVYADGSSYWDEDPCNNASIVLSDNVIAANYVGVMLYFGSYADVRDNVFVGNGVALAATAHQGTALVAHNIFVDNDEAMAIAASFLDIVDNVFVENESVLRQEACQAGVLRCNIVWSNGSIGDRLVSGIDDNLSVDPQLESFGPASYGFAPGSPALDRPCAADTVPVVYEGCGP